jgi:hypothetical protein
VDIGVDSDDFHIAVLMKFDCREHINYGESVIKCHLMRSVNFLIVASCKWCPCHATHLCYRYQEVNITIS